MAKFSEVDPEKVPPTDDTGPESAPPADPPPSGDGDEKPKKAEPFDLLEELDALKKANKEKRKLTLAAADADLTSAAKAIATAELGEPETAKERLAFLERAVQIVEGLRAQVDGKSATTTPDPPKVADPAKADGSGPADPPDPDDEITLVRLRRDKFPTTVDELEACIMGVMKPEIVMVREHQERIARAEDWASKRPIRSLKPEPARKPVAKRPATPAS